MTSRTTWKPHTKHGELTDRSDLPNSIYAFPRQGKEPLTDAAHVKNALAACTRSRGSRMPIAIRLSPTSKRRRNTTALRLRKKIGTNWAGSHIRGIPHTGEGGRCLPEPIRRRRDDKPWSIVPTVSLLAVDDICTNLGGRLELYTIVKDIEGKGDHTVATWILVSDTSRAKLFSAENREDNWTLLKDFEHPEGRKLSQDISPSAPPGRMQQSQGLGARRTSMEPHTWPKEASAERFAECLPITWKRPTVRTHSMHSYW